MKPEILKALSDAARKQGIPFQQMLKTLGENGLVSEQVSNPTNLILNKLITQDPRTIALKTKVEKLSKCQLPVLIIGETGTGKELLARALHNHRSGHFVSVNCAAISQELFEAELFGAVKGSYTGCISDRMGYMEYATNGTLFLDEIGDMPSFLQAKLLTALENKQIRRLGDNQLRVINCRLVSATNQETNKTLRPELLYRLRGSQLETIPLRDRPLDIPLIAKHLDETGVISEELLAKWSTQLFPGNIRELKNLIEEYIALL